jgi:hypothetical protein
MQLVRKEVRLFRVVEHSNLQSGRTYLRLFSSPSRTKCISNWDIDRDGSHFLLSSQDSVCEWMPSPNERNIKYTSFNLFNLYVNLYVVCWTTTNDSNSFGWYKMLVRLGSRLVVLVSEQMLLRSSSPMGENSENKKLSKHSDYLQCFSRRS